MLRYWQITIIGIKNNKDASKQLESILKNIPQQTIEEMQGQSNPTKSLIQTKQLLS